MNHVRSKINNEQWPEAEDLILIEGVTNYGKRWTKIVQSLPGRSDNSAKNRWNFILRTYQSRSPGECVSTGELKDEFTFAPERVEITNKTPRCSIITIASKIHCPEKMSISFILNQFCRVNSQKTKKECRTKLSCFTLYSFPGSKSISEKESKSRLVNDLKVCSV